MDPVLARRRADKVVTGTRPRGHGAEPLEQGIGFVDPCPRGAGKEVLRLEPTLDGCAVLHSHNADVRTRSPRGPGKDGTIAGRYLLRDRSFGRVGADHVSQWPATPTHAEQLHVPLAPDVT